MKRSDFEGGLRELDEGSADMPADADDRLRERLFRKQAPGFRWWLPAAATAAALTVTLVICWPARDTAIGGFEVHPAPGARAELTAAGTVKAQAGSATLTDVAQQAELQLRAGAEVSRLGTGARVHRGMVRFDVVHTGKRAAAYQVEVSDGVIDVLGTAFSIEQREGGGSVALERGSIRFRGADGREVLLAPGESLEWPLPSPPAQGPADEPAAPVAQKAPAREPALSSEAALEKVAVLRSRGRYEEAVAVLTRTLEQPGLSASTRDRLRFEIGSILTHQLRDPVRACAWWSAHPSQRYGVEVDAAVQLLGCGKK